MFYIDVYDIIALYSFPSVMLDFPTLKLWEDVVPPHPLLLHA